MGELHENPNEKLKQSVQDNFDFNTHHLYNHDKGIKAASEVA